MPWLPSCGLPKNVRFYSLNQSPRVVCKETCIKFTIRSCHQTCSIKKLFLKTQQYSQENKQENLEPLKSDSNRIFENTYFEEYLQTTTIYIGSSSFKKYCRPRPVDLQKKLKSKYLQQILLLLQLVSIFLHMNNVRSTRVFCENSYRLLDVN